MARVGPDRFAISPIIAAISVAAATVHAQPVDREKYIRHLPGTALIVAEAPASARLHLYGDTAASGYIDRHPMDGIDDRRAARLLKIAERFSPVLRRNNYLVPRDVAWVLGERPWLKVDDWLDERRVRTDSLVIDLSWAKEDNAGADSGNDARLEALLRDFNPRRLVPVTAQPGGRTARVLFLDSPGDGEKSWRTAYATRGTDGSRIYAHFLIHEDTTTTDDRRYLLAAQYLFFYPFNDGGNNHEGDWEHLNVLIGTGASISDPQLAQSRAGFMTEPEVLALLDGEQSIDALAICFVDYFFHNYVLRLDYRKSLRPDHDHRADPIPDSVTALWEDHEYIGRVVDLRVHASRGAFATHPIGYIGGNNKGPDELFHILPRFLKSFNRNTGATYPFPGTWQTIAPLGATETVWGALFPTVDDDSTHDTRALASRINADEDRWIGYDADAIELLPDWERLIPLARSNADVRRRWAWLLLPIRWGYPASASPGAGAVGNTDLGNVAPLGPAYKSWWNRTGPDIEHPPYHLRALRTPMSPRVPWSVIQSGWGLLNYPLVLSQLHPFYNMVGAHLSPWTLPLVGKTGLRIPKTFVAAEFQRIATVGGGAVQSFGGKGFARSLVRLTADRPEVRPLLEAGTHVRGERMSLNTEPWPRIALDLHLGRSVFMESSFTMGSGALAYSARTDTPGTDVALDGVLELRQLGAGFRSPLPLVATPNSQTFARLGYGWTWYTLHETRLNGSPIDGTLRGGYHPSLLPTRRSWPNMAYTGLTYEYFGPRKSWLIDRIGYGFRIDAAFTLQRLASHERLASRDLWMRRGDLALSATIGW